MSAPPRDWFAAQVALADVLRNPVPRDRLDVIAEARLRHPDTLDAFSANEAEFALDMTGIGVSLTLGAPAIDLLFGFLSAQDEQGRPIGAECDRVREEVKARHALTVDDELVALALADAAWSEVKSRRPPCSSRASAAVGRRGRGIEAALR